MKPAHTPQLQQPWLFFAVFFAGGPLEVDERGLFIGDFARSGLARESIGDFARSGLARASIGDFARSGLLCESSAGMWFTDSFGFVCPGPVGA
jgi:hypothetical protein